MHAGHGLNYANVAPVAALPEVVELNIGHVLIGAGDVRAGWRRRCGEMKALMQAARAS